MNRKNKILVGIIIVGLIGLGAFMYDMFLAGPNLSQGDKTILVLAVDESEQRPGMGAVDMTFVIQLKNGHVVNYTPVYPGGMKHPTQPEPANAQAQGAGSRLLLHDSLWDADTVKGMNYAKEIVEANTNFTPDVVVAVNTEAMDAIISSAGGVKIKGVQTNISAADIIRENDQLHGGPMTRGEAVLSLVSALSKAAKNEATRGAMIQTALDQYSKGNIVMVPSGSFISLLFSKGFDSL